MTNPVISLSLEQEAQVNQYNQAGWALLHNQQWGDAEKCFLDALRLKPDFVNALDGIATALIRLKRYDDALHRIFRAMEIAIDAERTAIAGYAFLEMDRRIEALVLLGMACASPNPKPHWKTWHEEIRNRFARKYSDIVQRDVCLLVEKNAQGQPAIEPVPIHPEVVLIKYQQKYVGLPEAYQIAARLVNPSAMGKGKREDLVMGQRLMLTIATLNLTPAVATDLAVAAHLSSRFNEALRFYLLALWLDPGFVPALANLGAALARAQAGAAAVWLLRLVTRMDPGNVQGWGNLAASLCQERRNPLEAERAARNSLRLNPDQEFMAVNLAFALREQGRVDEAVEVLANLSEKGRQDQRVKSSLLLTLLYQYGADRTYVAEEHKAMGRGMEAPYLKLQKPHTNNPDLDRKLRVGFVSPDLICHPVSNFIEPWWKNYDHGQFEFYVYHNLLREDNVSERLKSYITQWTNVTSFTDEDLTQRIRDDQIDILFDLTGHTANHRLLVFARKPAPVQVSYLGYAHTSGMSSIGWRFSDPYHDLEDAQQFYSEKMYKLDDIVCCYQPALRNPELADSERYAVRDTPALKNGYITFGCCNNFAKINYKVIDVWSALLRAVPDSRLLIESVGLDNAELVAEVEKFFLDRGITPDRLRLMPRLSHNQYVLYHEIDIALDPFPYNGGTTNADLLWMGTPLITLEGQSAVSRMGVAFLSVLNRHQWIARTEEDYVRIGVELAADIVKLDNERKRLKADFKNSRIMDGKAFADDVGKGLRYMWQQWCLAAKDKQHVDFKRKQNKKAKRKSHQ